MQAVRCSSPKPVAAYKGRLLAYLPACLLAYLPTCLLAYLLAYVLAYLLAYVLAYLRTCLLAYLLAYVLAYLPTCLLAYLPACLLACLPILACLRTCLLAYLPTCFLAYRGAALLRAARRRGTGRGASYPRLAACRCGLDAHQRRGRNARRLDRTSGGRAGLHPQRTRPPPAVWGLAHFGAVPAVHTAPSALHRPFTLATYTYHLPPPTLTTHHLQVHTAAGRPRGLQSGFCPRLGRASRLALVMA